MNNTNLYLDLYGLHYYNEKLKKYVNDKEVKTDDVTISKNASGELEVTGLKNTTVNGDLNFTLGNIINPSTILGVDNITFNNFGDITFSGKTLINQNSISTETVDAEYLLAGDTSTNRCTFISSEGISFIPTGMQISPTTISGVDNILMNSNSGAGVISFNNGNTYIHDNSIESSGIVAKESLGVGGNLMTRYTPAVYITPLDITFLRNDTGSINNIKSINMNGGSINGLTNINTISGTITNLDSIHFHSGGNFIYGASIKVNSEGTLDTPPLEVYHYININKAGGYGGSQSVITNDGITTFYGTYYRVISVGDETGSLLIVLPEKINFYSSTLGGTLENVHSINMNNGLISGISDIYSSTGEINLHSGNINMYNGKISGILEINGHLAFFTTGLFDTIGTALLNILNVNCAVKFSGVITGGNFSNLVLDDHITYSGSNNTFTLEYIDQLKNALGIN